MEKERKSSHAGKKLSPMKPSLAAIEPPTSPGVSALLSSTRKGSTANKLSFSTDGFGTKRLERAHKRLDKEEVHSIVNGTSGVNIQRIKLISLQTKSEGAQGGRKEQDVYKMALLCENSCDWFKSQTEDTVYEVCRHIQSESFVNNSVVFRKGDPASKVYIVLMGSVEVSGMRHGAGESSSKDIKQGDIVGNDSVLSLQPRSGTCVAKGYSELLAIPRYYFLTAFKAEFAVENREALSWLRSKIQILQSLSEDEMQALARLLSVEEVQRGRLFNLDQSKSLYFIRDGEFKVVVPDPSDMGKPYDSQSMFKKDFKDLTRREKSELKEMKKRRLGRCHTIMHLTAGMVFGDTFEEAFPSGSVVVKAAGPEGELNEELVLGCKGWFAQAVGKCTIYEVSKQDIKKYMPQVLSDRLQAAARFRFQYYAGRYVKYFHQRDNQRKRFEDEDMMRNSRPAVTHFEFSAPVLAQKVRSVIDIAEVIKQEPTRHAVPTPHHAIGSSISSAPIMLSKYYDSSSKLSTPHSIKMIDSLSVPLSPFFNVKKGKWMNGAPRAASPERQQIRSSTPAETFFLTGGGGHSPPRTQESASKEDSVLRSTLHFPPPEPLRKLPPYPSGKLRPAWVPESALGNPSRYTNRFQVSNKPYKVFDRPMSM